MKVRELLNKIDELKSLGKLTDDSDLTVHVYINDGLTVEWKDDVFIECFGPYGDGLQINVDGKDLNIRY